MDELTPEKIERIEEAARAGGGHRLQFTQAPTILALCVAWRELQELKKSLIAMNAEEFERLARQGKGALDRALSKPERVP